MIRWHIHRKYASNLTTTEGKKTVIHTWVETACLKEYTAGKIYRKTDGVCCFPRGVLSGVKGSLIMLLSSRHMYGKLSRSVSSTSTLTHTDIIGLLELENTMSSAIFIIIISCFHYLKCSNAVHIWVFHIHINKLCIQLN